MSSSQHTLESQFADTPAPDELTGEILEEETVDAEIVEEDHHPVLDDAAAAAASLGQLYGDQEEITAMAKAVRTVAPWANDPKFTLTNHEIGLAIRRCRALGLDPLNPHEVQIWKDKHGLHLQLAYPLLTQWVRETHGGHTAPTYRELTAEELDDEGLPDCVPAIRCSFILDSDLDRMLALIEAGFDPAEARALFTRHGLGTATISDWTNPYFAPNGRSKRWKLRKRALTDAYRMLFGSPSRDDIIQLRRSRHQHLLTPEDFAHIADDLLPYQQRIIAQRKAARRLGQEDPVNHIDEALPADRPRDRNRLFRT